MSEQQDTYEADNERARALIQEYIGNRAMRPPAYGNKRAISIKLSSVALDGLREIASQMGYIYNGQGNVSMLIEAIGTHTVKVESIPLSSSSGSS